MIRNSVENVSFCRKRFVLQNYIQFCRMNDSADGASHSDALNERPLFEIRSLATETAVVTRPGTQPLRPQRPGHAQAAASMLRAVAPPWYRLPGPAPAAAAGFLLSVVLTVVPFWLVMSGGFDKWTTVITILVFAVVQIAVHLKYFLHQCFEFGC